MPSEPESSAKPSPYDLPRQQVLLFLLVLAAITLVILMRLYRLDDLQRELYGDIAILYEYVLRVKTGEWPFDFSLSAGPLYHYLIMPVVALFGMNYFAFKLASVVVSLGVLVGTFLVGRRLIDNRFGLLAMFVAGVSSWLLIFSRLGNSQILVPCLTILSLWLAVRVVQHGRRLDVILCAVVSALGLYVYPQSFILPGVVWVTLLALRWTGNHVSWSQLRLFILISLLCALPFVTIFGKDPVALKEGYIGVKLTSDNPALVLLNNIGKTAASLHLKGDSNFRSNISTQPHLDWLSGLLFILGIIYWLRPEKRALAPTLFVPLLLLPLPSILVLNAAGDVPSASRTLGVAPVVYILVASGVWWLYWLIVNHGRQRLAWLATCLILLGIVLLNSQRYFQTYLAGLPYHNTPIGQLITDYAESLPQETQIFLVDCCWREDMPEPKSIEYSLKSPDRFQRIASEEMFCEQLLFLKRPSVFIWSYQNELPAPQLEACASWLPAQLFTGNQNLPAFYAAPLCCLEEVFAEMPGLDFKPNQLDYDTAVFDGQVLGVRHSPLDMGTVHDLFDQNVTTLLRGKEANPLVLELRLDEPQSIESIALDLATMPQFELMLTLFYADGSQSTVTEAYVDLPADPHLSLPLDNPEKPITVLRIEIKDTLLQEDMEAHIHVREIYLNKQ